MLVVALALAMLLTVTAMSLTWLVQHRRAARRANDLLHALLTSGEMESLHTQGYLEVRSQSTSGRVYRIPAEPGLVAVIDGGIRSGWLCARPLRSIPAPEQVLVHKLMLEGAEAEYWRQANLFSGFTIGWQPGGNQVAVWTSRGPGVLGQRCPACAAHPDRSARPDD